MSDKNTYTRRSALALLGSGAALAVSETAGVRSTENILRRQGTLSVGDGSNADISITDRRGNAPGAGNFGNYDPRASGGKTYLSVGNSLGGATTVAASNTNTSVSYDGSDSEISDTSDTDETPEDITLSHTQSSGQTTDLSVSDGSVSQELSLDNDISVPVAPSSAVSRWTFNDAETDSSTSTDVWGSNNGTLNGATTGATGANVTYTTGEAYEFVGGSNTSTPTYVSVPNDTTLDISSISYSMWVYNDKSGDTYANALNRRITRKWGGNPGYGLRYNDSVNEWEADMVDSNNSVRVATGETVDTNTWVHFTVTHDETDLKLYVDGSEKDSASTGFATPQNDKDILIGAAESDNNEDSFGGKIDDVRIYDKGLSATEVSNLYQTGHINGN